MRLTGVEAAAQKRLRDVAVTAAGGKGGVILWFAAQFARTRAFYEQADSLVWRDAGALVATVALLAETLDLACCPLGVTGEPLLSQVLGSDDAVVGAGGCMIGARID